MEGDVNGIDIMPVNGCANDNIVVALDGISALLDDPNAVGGVVAPPDKVIQAHVDWQYNLNPILAFTILVITKATFR